MNLTTSPIHAHTDRSARARPSALSRGGILLHGVASYAVGVTALVYLILLTLDVLPFTGGPVHIESPLLGGLFDLGLVVIFGVQHSLMARQGFKERWVRVIHPSMERSTYVLATGVALLPLLALWQPLPATLWSVHEPLARELLRGVAVVGWAYLFIATYAIDHFELFGLQQSWRAFTGAQPAAAPFRVRWMYRFDRHPIMTGLLVGLWATPEMTAGHLLLAGAFSIYVVIGVHFEERALLRQWGATYEAYRRRVPAIVPVFHA